MHIVTVSVRIPDEEWEHFKADYEESGQFQFKYRNSTIFAELSQLLL